VNIVLCGMMGSGKTSVAKAYSALYGANCVDTDEVIVSRYGTISNIFADRGEEYFRDIESKIVEEVSAKDSGTVISLGGGCVLRKKNVLALKSTGKIFYLKAEAATVIKRLKGDSSRPLLQGNLEEKVNSILSSREAVYEAAADFIVPTDELTPKQIAERIHKLI